MQLLETTNDIRRALGEAYQCIQKFDKHSKERASSMRKQLIEDYQRICASCGKTQRDGVQLDGAHIWSLEEGGRTTLDNLVLLCGDCHKYYDLGYASFIEMKKCADHWYKGSSFHLKEVMVKRKEQVENQHPFHRPLIDPKGLLKRRAVYDEVQLRKWRKALEKLHQIQKLRISRGDRNLIIIVEAQIHRRRSAHGVLRTAHHLLEKVDVNQLATERLPLYYYELGYVNQLMGLIKEANKLFAKSHQCAIDLGDKYSSLESIMAEAQQIATEIIGSPRESLMSQSIEFYADRLNLLAHKAEKINGPYGGRWALNCLAWKANLLLKFRDYFAAFQSFNYAKKLRDKQDVTTGLTKEHIPYLVKMQGLLILAKPHPENEEIEDALRLISRAVVPLIQGNRQRPEGIRDSLLGFEKGLSLLQHSNFNFHGSSGKIRFVRETIMDGASFLDPYRLST